MNNAGLGLHEICQMDKNMHVSHSKYVSFSYFRLLKGRGHSQGASMSTISCWEGPGPCQ